MILGWAASPRLWILLNGLKCSYLDVFKVCDADIWQLWGLQGNKFPPVNAITGDARLQFLKKKFTAYWNYFFQWIVMRLYRVSQPTESGFSNIYDTDR